MLHHTLITRFNLATPGREVYFRHRPGWLEERFDLFERYCLPGVAAQTCQDFDWIVFLDEHTPDWARETLVRLQAVRPFHAHYSALFGSEGWARAVRMIAGTPVTGRILLTSNLDSDDSLALDYIERVQQTARVNSSGSRFAINVPEGCILADRKLYAHRHAQNAFTNLCEPDDGHFITTMNIRHMELADHVQVIQAEGPPGWLQVVHGGNVSNRIRGRRVGGAEASRQFPMAILGEIIDPSLPVRMAETLAFGPLRALRDHLFAVARRIVRVDRASGNA